MADHSFAALMSITAGYAAYSQTVELPLPVSALTTLISMAAAGLVTWGMFKKASDRHEAEIELLRKSLVAIHNTLADVRERIARIEGKLDQPDHTH